MNRLSSLRVGKHRARRRPLPDPRPISPVLRRRSARIESRLRSVSIPHTLEFHNESLSSLEQGPTNPRISQQPLTQVSSSTRVPALDPVESSVLTPPRAQAQEDLSSPEKHNHQILKRGYKRSIETDTKRPLKRARLTKRNLKAFENMRGRDRTSGKESKSKPTRSRKSSHSEAKTWSSTATESSGRTLSTTNSNFPPLAHANGILQEPNSKPPSNLKSLQDRLNRHRATASPTQSEYEVAAHKLLIAENEGTIAEETSKLLKDYRVKNTVVLPTYHLKIFLRTLGLITGYQLHNRI